MPELRLCLLTLLAWTVLFSFSVAAQSNTLELTLDEGTWMSLDVSPNGKKLVFELLGEIYELPATGGQARPLLTGRAFQSQPRFSPDGDTLVYISDESGSDNVWLASSGGENPRALTDLPRALMWSPTWSVDGRSIFVTVCDDGGPREAEIWRYDAQTGEGEQVVSNANGRPSPLVSSPPPGAYGPQASPDGRSLVHTSVTPRPYGSRTGASSMILRYDLESGRSEPVMALGTNAMKPAISGNGQWLVYAADFQGKTGLKVRNLETGVERWLQYPIQRHQLEGRATRDVLPNFAIAPNSRYVFAAFDGKIHRLSLDEPDITVIPFTAHVALETTPTLDFPRRLETGPVRARRIQHLTLGPGPYAAFSALARIYVIDTEGGTPRRLTTTQRPREFMPAWSPGGRWIAFVTWDEVGGHLWKTRATGETPPVRLSAAPALWLDPVWTPDGEGIVVLTAPLGSARSARRSPTRLPSDMRLVEVATHGGSQDLTPRVDIAATGLRHPRFADDSGRIFLTSAEGLVSIKRNGTDRRNEEHGPGELNQETPGSAPIYPSIRVEAPRATPSGTVVLRGAKVVTMQGYEMVENADLVIVDNRVTSVGPRGKTPAGARIIDVAGKVIVPGFIDIHAHFQTPSDLLEPESTAAFANLAFGVTSLRNPQSSPDIFALADIVDVDGVPSPRLFSTGPGIALGFYGGGHYAAPSFASLGEVRRTLLKYRDEYGTHLLKSYLFGNRRQRQWVVEVSRELGMMPTAEGGADTKGNLTHAIDGFSGNEHAFPVAPIYDDLVQLVARTGITYTPTLVVSFGGALPIFRLLAEKRPHQNARLSRWFDDEDLYTSTSSRVLWFPPEAYNDREVAAGARAILEAGGRVALGGHGEVQGLSAHWEMELLASGGMKPHDVLRVATIFGAEAMGYGQDLGSLEAGKLADLVVLDRDPLSDIRATTAIRYVMKNGVLYEAETLDQVWPEERQFTLPWWLD